MATTTKGLPYPTTSDEPTVTADIQALAESVDNLLILASGDNAWTGNNTFDTIREALPDGTISTNVLTLDYAAGNSRWIGTAPSANFTINITNAPTTDGYAITVTVLVTQGATGYRPSVVQVAGTGVTIKWQGGTAPTPNNGAGKIDIFSFTLIRKSGAWTCLGSMLGGFA